MTSNIIEQSRAETIETEFKMVDFVPCVVFKLNFTSFSLDFISNHVIKQCGDFIKIQTEPHRGLSQARQKIPVKTKKIFIFTNHFE